jgi:hypothetical protein
MEVFLSGAVWPGFQLDPDVDLYGMNAVELDLHLVPGERDSMMREPHVGVLAEQLRISLDTSRVAAFFENADRRVENNVETFAMIRSDFRTGTPANAMR